jgi:hypothetical protein
MRRTARKYRLLVIGYLLGGTTWALLHLWTSVSGGTLDLFIIGLVAFTMGVASALMLWATREDWTVQGVGMLMFKQTLVLNNIFSLIYLRSSWVPTDNHLDLVRAGWIVSAPMYLLGIVLYLWHDITHAGRTCYEKMVGLVYRCTHRRRRDRVSAND